MIIFGIETTSLSREKAGMLSLGAVHLESGKEFYQECVPTGPEYEIDWQDEAFNVNGFNRQEIQDTIEFQFPGSEIYKKIIWDKQLYQKFENWALKECKDTLLGGHNIGSFDCLILHRVFNGTLDMSWCFGHRFVDIGSIGYSVFGESLSSEKLAIKLGLAPEPKPHNALLGAKKELECFIELKKMIARK